MVSRVVVGREQAEFCSGACVHLVSPGVTVELDLFRLARGKRVELTTGQILHATLFIAVAFLFNLLTFFNKVSGGLALVHAVQTNVIAARHEVRVCWHRLNAFDVLKTGWFVCLHCGQRTLR